MNNFIELERSGKTTKVNAKWRKRFEKDGWKVVGKTADEPPAPQKVSNGDMASLIDSSETKDQLESLIKDAFNVDLDKRKGLDKLKAEALELVNES